MSHRWAEWAQQMHAIAQSGLTYTDCPYELERYETLRRLSLEVVEEYTSHTMQAIESFFEEEKGYATPKVDVRGVVFQDGKLLMVQEKIDNRWSLPGGWADVGLSPAENAVKEVFEESGLEVAPEKLLAVLDRGRHGHPPGPFHLYKIFIRCGITGGELQPGMETLDARFFDRNELPPLSINRVTPQQIALLFEYHDHPDKTPVFD